LPEYVSCNLCGADDAKPVVRLRDYRLRVDDTAWSVVQCRRCSLGYLNPRPTTSEMARYYPETYFAHRTASNPRYARQAARIGGEAGDLLEIGDARGDFLRIMQRRGWRVVGLEPSSAMGAGDVTILRARFPAECPLPKESFDVIAAWSVFEHLHDRGTAFNRCAEVLRPGGRLVIQVPNFASIQSRWALMEDVPRHLYFFTRRTLEAYAMQANLTVRRVEYPTDLGPASGRGVMRLALVRAACGTVDDFFDFYQSTRKDRFRRSPVLAALWTATAGVERVLLSDRLTSAVHVSGQIVCDLVRTGEAKRKQPSKDAPAGDQGAIPSARS
jgi:SAM-dependent methyltransferase